MKKLKFMYERTLTFEDKVGTHYFSLKCIPPQTNVQQVGGLNFAISPYTSLLKTKDVFGNNLYTGCIKELHDHFCFQVKGEVCIKEGPTINEKLVPLFKYPSTYTALEGKLEQYDKSLRIPKFYKPLDEAIFLMETLSEQMHYEANCTDIHTTGAEAFLLGKGVCQDYAHVFLALCRARQIPAKYVAGFIVGEGETHAWTEVYSEGLWYGLDPTHNCRVDDTYIKLATGRDYGDCNIDKGLFYGNTMQRQEIMVKVEECYD